MLNNILVFVQIRIYIFQIDKFICTLANKGARCFHAKQYSSCSPDVLAKSNFTFDVAK